MENVAFLTRKKLTMDKFSTQVKVTTVNPIKKILNATATAVISSCEKNYGYISLSGKIKANVVFENKLDMIDHAEVFFDFIEKQQQSIELDDMVATDSIALKNISFSGTEVICVFEHSVSVTGNYSYEIPAFSGEDKNLVLRSSSFDSLKFITSAEDNFVVAEENEVNLLDVSVLSSSASVIVTEVSSLVDKISVEGKIVCNIVCSDAESVSQLSKEFEFRQEVEAAGVLPNMTISANVMVKNITVTPEVSENKTNLVYAFDLFLKANVYEDYTYEIVEDMFSLTDNISTTYDYIEARTFAKMKNFTETSMLSEDISKLENFDDIVGIYLPEFILDSIEETEGKASLIGKIVSQALYKTDSDYSVMQTELPVRFEIIPEQGTVLGDVRVYPEVSSFKVKAGRYLEIIYTTNYSAVFEQSVSRKFVKEFEILGSKEASDAGIKIYITKDGETLFDVAKSLNVRPETIESQNEVTDTFDGGQKIYIYSPINLL